MSFVNRVIDLIEAAGEVIDSYFVRTNTYPVDISEAEATETAHYDAMCQDTNRRRRDSGYQPRNKNLRQY